MAKVLELIELLVKDGSMKMDYRGRPECRSFVLETSGDFYSFFLLRGKTFLYITFLIWFLFLFYLIDMR